MIVQLDLPFLFPERLLELLDQIDQGDPTDLASWCTTNAVYTWCWTVDAWQQVLELVYPRPILLGIIVAAVAPFWLRSLEGFQRAAGVWPLAKLDSLRPDDDQALWDSCCVAAFWWCKCGWNDGIRHLLFLSREPVWTNALLFRWVLPRESISQSLRFPLAIQKMPIMDDFFLGFIPGSRDVSISTICQPDAFLPADFSETKELIRASCVEEFWERPLPPVPMILNGEIRDIMEMACLDRTGVLDRLLRIPAFVAVCVDEPSFLFGRAARLGLTRVLDSLEGAGLTTIPVVAEVAEASLLHGHKDVWLWVLNRSLEDLRHTAFMAHQFHWLLPPTQSAERSARWLVDWMKSNPSLMDDRLWFDWSSRLAQILLFHQGGMPTSFAGACSVLLEPDPVDRVYILKALLGPLGVETDIPPDGMMTYSPALGLILDFWPTSINDLEEILRPSEWRRLSFHYRVQRVMLSRQSGLSGQENEENERTSCRLM